MIRKTFIALAVMALAVTVTTPAFAGGRSGGGGGKSNYTVRVKNNGNQSAVVGVTQGATATLAGSKTLGANAVGQWSVKKGQFAVGAWDPASATGSALSEQLFNAGPARLIYALAAVDAAEGVATVTGSTGQKF
jgi:hypothetical protein